MSVSGRLTTLNDAPGALAAREPGAPPAARLRGTAEASGELLRSPASGASCAHWRLRIFEALGASMELVHEVIAPDPFAIAWSADPLQPPRTVQLGGDRVHIRAQPLLHHEGSPGARAVAEHFGLMGRVRVEEVLVRQGEPLEAEGLLYDPEAVATGPYRGGQGVPQLFEATVRLSTGIALRPALLPWALGTAAALLTAAGAASAVSKLRKIRFDAAVHAEIDAVKYKHRRWP
jgi:hypothetical protein